MTNFDTLESRKVNITVKYVEGWVKEEDGANFVLRIPFCRTYTIKNTCDTDESLRLRVFDFIRACVGRSSEPLLTRLYTVIMVAFHETGDVMSGEWRCNGDECVFVKASKKVKEKPDAYTDED